jgi:hypothetical protein
LTKAKDWSDHPVVILVGSSVTNYGIDPERLEANLADNGIRATVLSFCMPGDNHHERLYMLETFLAELGDNNRKKLAEAQVLYLGEIFDAYDLNPLYRIEKEASTERAILFLNPTKSIQAWSAYQKFLEENPDAPRARIAWLLFEHSLMNRLAVGAFSSMRPAPARGKRTPPFFALEGSKESFDYDDAVRAFTGESGKQVTRPGLPPPFLASFGDLRKVMDPYVDAYGFYCLPTLEPGRSEYGKAFSQFAPEGTFVLGPATRGEMSDLMFREEWFDGVHPTGSGAKKFTDWISKKLEPRLREDSN